jgi:DNA-binding transcriptional ArsR family regulator
MAGSVALMNLLDVALVAFVTHGAHVFDSAGGVVGWCRVNGIARATFYRHLARVRQDGSWAPLSRRPRRSPGGTAPPVVAAILALRESLGVDNGAVTIHYHLGRDPDLAGMRIPSPATIHKILRRAGLVTAQPNKRPRSSWRRFSYARPRDCYQIDATIVALAGGAKVVVFEVLDDGGVRSSV